MSKKLRHQYNQNNINHSLWRTDISKEGLLELYANKKWSIDKICKYYSADYKVIERRFELWNISKRTPSEQGRLSKQIDPTSKKGNRKIYLALAKSNRKWRCEMCGTTETNENFDLVVHHKDENNRNNDLNNIKILCGSCHGKLHQELNNTKGIIKDRNELGRFKSWRKK